MSRQNTVGSALGHLETQPGADPDKVLGIRGKAQTIDNRKLALVVDKEQARRIETARSLSVQGRSDLGRRAQIHIAATQLLKGKLTGRANDVVGAASTYIAAVFVFNRLRPARLVGALTQAIGGNANLKRGAQIDARCNNACLIRVLLDREQRHTTTVNTPTVHFHALELGSDTGIEDTLLHILRHTRTVIQEEEGANTLLLGRGKIDLIGSGIASIAQHLDDNVLYMLNVMLGLTALGLRNAEADIPLAKVFLDAKVALPRHRRDK